MKKPETPTVTAVKKRKFPSGTALMVLLAMNRHETVDIATMRREIETVTGVKLGNAGIIAVLANLQTGNYVGRNQLERKGALKRGEHIKYYSYEVTAAGKGHLNWMLKNIDHLREEN